MYSPLRFNLHVSSIIVHYCNMLTMSCQLLDKAEVLLGMNMKENIFILLNYYAIETYINVVFIVVVF